MLKNGGKYAQLRIKCREHESRIAALPSLEKTTQRVAHISKRISDLSAQAMMWGPAGCSRRGGQRRAKRPSLNACKPVC